ncbi:hypothetical protein M2412_002532 [Stenotrophomonas rhizophila]|uniref:Uncharacterized protein n=1 Tax=Stenotrophomonas rhizophila TaxID=216778 RepID=A0AAW5PJE5_9GAMM|nr:hypothetical protein [Stenotrophomonas rhizophila]
MQAELTELGASRTLPSALISQIRSIAIDPIVAMQLANYGRRGQSERSPNGTHALPDSHPGDFFTLRQTQYAL